MFSNPLDPNNCFVDIQAGSGGTEAQDWAAMLERMYLKYCDRKGFTAEVLEQTAGEVAGIKSATLKISGDYAYGSLRTETGVHRLVRKSPVRLERPAPHLVRERVRLSRGRRVDRGRDQPGRPAHRHLPRLRRRRPARQQDRLRGAHHAPADRHRGAVPERPLAAPQPRRGDGDAEVAALRARAAQAPGRARASSRTPRPTSAGATRSAPTCSTSRASRTCAPASRRAPRRRCSTATSTTSSPPA